jgi:hypothetical protein
MREIRSTYKILTGKPEEKRLLERRRHRYENNTRINLE